MKALILLCLVASSFALDLKKIELTDAEKTAKLAFYAGKASNQKELE